VQAATARAAATARTKDPWRIVLDRVVFFISKVAPACVNNIAGNADIFIFHPLVGHQPRSG
jgi:hypothetical protein